MKYLMTYQNEKKPLRFSKQISGFAIDAGSLGKVYPVLVPADSTDSAKSSLRIKLNNQIKAFTTIPSVILPETLQAKTGSTLEDPQGFTHSYDVNVIHNVQYNEYEGFFYAIGNYTGASDVNPTIEIKFSMDGVNWNYMPYDSTYNNMLGYTFSICKNEKGLIFFNVWDDWSRVEYERGDIYYYVIVYASRNGSVYEVYRHLIQKIHYDGRESEYKHVPSAGWFGVKIVACKPDAFAMDRYSVMFAYRTCYREYSSFIIDSYFAYTLVLLYSSSITAEADKHDQMNVTEGPPTIFYSNSDRAYVYSSGRKHDWSYNGYTWYTSQPYPEIDEGKVGDYTILRYEDIGGYPWYRTVMTKDGGQTTITVDKRVCGFDPVDKTYLAQEVELKRKGDGTDYDIIAKIFSTSDLSTWTLLKTINYGKSPYWASNIGGSEALNTYAALGFTD